MTKMAATPIYGKNPLEIFQNQKADALITRGNVALGCGAYQVCSNDDPKLTLNFLTSRSNLLSYAFKCDFCFEKLIF